MHTLILKLALKNTIARPSRTILAVVMIALSMSLMIALVGLYDGMATNMIEKNKLSDSGDVSIYANGYRLSYDVKHNIKNATKIRDEILKLPDVSSVYLRLRADGLVATARKSSFASINGIGLDDGFDRFVKEGSFDIEKNGCVMGIELAKSLKLKVGSKVVFSTQDAKGEINSIALRVNGIVQTTNISHDKSSIFTDIKTVQRFLGLGEDVVTQIAINGENLESVLKQKYKSYDVKTFLELQPTMKMMQDMTVVFNSITFFIVMGVVFIGIFGVLYVSVLERLKEFGIMKSIGMHYRYIREQIVLEAVFIGLFGYVVGAVFGLVALVYLRDIGLDFASFSDALSMWGYESVIYGTIKLSYFINTFIAIMLASLLSVVLPLLKIKRLNPVDVIKIER